MNSQHELSARFVAAREKNGRPPIVLLHGWGSSSQTWESMQSLLNREHDLVCIDLPGFGDSASVPVVNLDNMLQKLAGLLPEQCHLVGWSLGGMLATALAARYSNKIDKLVTLATNPSFIVRQDWPAAMATETFREFCEGFVRTPEKTCSRFFMLQVQGDQHRRQVLGELKQRQPAVSGAWKRTLELLGEINNCQVLTQISHPCLHLFGDNDALVPVEAARTLVELGEPHRVEILKHTGHALHLSQPRQVAEKILDHLNDSPYRKKKQAIARSFSRAADRYESVAVLQKKVARNLISLGPEYHGNIADLGCGTGFCAEQVGGVGSTVFAIDLAFGMLKTARGKRGTIAHWVGGDMEQLPLATGSLDGVISSMSVQWCESLAAVFAEVRRALKPEGWFLFSTLGPETLGELAAAWQAVDGYVHVNRFQNNAEISRLLQATGFDVEKVETKREQLFYPDVLALMRDLKTIGAHNVNAGQNQGLTGKQKIERLQRAYESFRNSAGELPATYDVYYFFTRGIRD